MPKPRLHFDYFVPALLTVFTLLTGEWADGAAPARSRPRHPLSTADGHR